MVPFVDGVFSSFPASGTSRQFRLLHNNVLTYQVQDRVLRYWVMYFPDFVSIVMGVSRSLAQHICQVILSVALVTVFNVLCTSGFV